MSSRVERRDPSAERKIRDWAAPLALVVASAALLPVLTSGSTAVPSSPLWLALVGGAALVALAPRHREIRWYDPLTALAVGLAAAAPHLAPGMVLGHDAPLHSWAAHAYRDAWQHGDLVPIWLHQIGFGQPQPIFYGPLPFWVMAPFAPFGPAAMMSGSLALSEIVAALAAWHVVARWTRRPEAAFVAAAAWTFAPYRLLDAHFRTALGEAWSLALLPWLLAAFFELLARPTPRRFVAASGVTALTVLAHPLSLAMLAVLLPVLWLVATPPRRGAFGAAARAALRGAAAALGGLLLAGFFTLPLIVELPAIDLATTLPNPVVPIYQHNGAHLFQLVERKLYSELGWSIPDTLEQDGSSTEMPYYAGAALLAALAGAAFAAARRAERRAGSPVAALAALGTSALLLSLAPVAHATGRLPGIEVLQFPWRFLGPAGAATALLLGLLAARVPADAGPRGKLLLALVLAVVVADGWPYAGAVSRLTPWDGLSLFAWEAGIQSPQPIEGPTPLRVRGRFLPPNLDATEVGSVSAYREYFTPAVNRLVIGYAERRARVGLADQGKDREPLRIASYPYARFMDNRRSRHRALRYTRGAGRIVVEVGRRGGRLEVGEQYFPGWQVDLGRGWRETRANEVGLLSVRVPRGLDRVRFRFHRWRWDRALGWTVTALALLAGAAVWRRSAPERGAGDSPPHEDVVYS